MTPIYHYAGQTPNQYKATDELATDKDVDSIARVKARQFAFELDVAVHALHADTLAIKMAQRSFLLTSSTTFVIWTIRTGAGETLLELCAKAWRHITTI